MILKLRVLTHTGTHTCSWKMIDKVSRLSWEFVDKTPELRKHAETACMMWINSYPMEDPDPDGKRKRIAQVHVVYDDEECRHETFYTDDMVFIMNDNGKTTDTINVNI